MRCKVWVVVGVVYIVLLSHTGQTGRSNRWRLAVLLPVAIALAACTSAAPTTSTTTSPPTTQHEEHAVVRWLTVAGAGGSFWLLGDYPCAAGTCFAVMESTDDGATFTRVAAPSLAVPVESEGGFGVNDFVFANRDDGYFYVLNPKPHLYWTGDGGMSWRPIQPGGSSVWRDSWSSGPLASSIVTTHGRAYVLIFRSSSKGAYPTSYALASSAVTDDSWTTVPLPVPGPSRNDVSMAAFGSKVWLIVVPGGGGNAEVLLSDDEGRSYSPLPTTGMLGLSCRATATSSTTLWGFCATGNAGYPVRSTDGGRDFKDVTAAGGTSNAGIVVAVSDDVAVFQWLSPDLLLTRDGGRTVTSVLRNEDSQGGFDVAFATTTSWLALGNSAGETSLLWRTTNGGRSWHPVKLPSL
jgi:photosystem II stability/assembly factor-like uncharacterized protein